MVSRCSSDILSSYPTGQHNVTGHLLFVNNVVKIVKINDSVMVLQASVEYRLNSSLVQVNNNKQQDDSILDP